MPKGNVKGLLANKPAEQEIIRGQGYTLSTEIAEQPTLAEEVQEKVDRRSVRIRADLLKSCKRLAVDEDTTLAEIIEEAVEYWLHHERPDAK